MSSWKWPPVQTGSSRVSLSLDGAVQGDGTLGTTRPASTRLLIDGPRSGAAAAAAVAAVAAVAAAAAAAPGGGQGDWKEY